MILLNKDRHMQISREKHTYDPTTGRTISVYTLSSREAPPIPTQADKDHNELMRRSAHNRETAKIIGTILGAFALYGVALTSVGLATNAITTILSGKSRFNFPWTPSLIQLSEDIGLRHPAPKVQNKPDAVPQQTAMRSNALSTGNNARTPQKRPSKEASKHLN